MTPFLIACAILAGWLLLVKLFSGIVGFNSQNDVGGLADWVVIQSRIDRLIEITKPSDYEADYPPDEAGQWRQFTGNAMDFTGGAYTEGLRLARWLEDRGVAEINTLGDVRILNDRSTRT